MSLTLQHKLSIWLIIIIGLVLYLPTFFNGFVWDDEEQILNNIQMKSLTNIPAFFSGSTFNSGGGSNLSGLYYRPLMTTAFALVYSLFGPNAFFFHFLQVAIHIANAILIYLILFYVFRRHALDFRIPLFGSLLFLVHPISVEAVSYLSGYQEVLYFFFGALAFYLILIHNEAPRPDGRGIFSPPSSSDSRPRSSAKGDKPKKIFLAGCLIVVSLFAKETAIVFAGVIFLYLLLFETEKLKVFAISQIAAFAIYGFMRFGVAGVFFHKHGLTPVSNMDFWQRMISIPQIILYYIKTFFFPLNLIISQQWVVTRINVGDFWRPLFWDCFFIAGLLVLGVLVWKKKRTIFKFWLFFVSWFLAALVFHLQILPLDLTVSDRWFYLALAGVSGLVVVASQLIRLRCWFVWVAIALLVLLATRTFVREFDWHDGLTLYSHDIQFSQDSFDLQNNLGVELFRDGRIDGAKAHFQRSTELSPQWWTNWNNLGAVYEREGKLDQAEDLYRRSIDNGQYYLAYENYAKILYRQKKYDQLRTFLEQEALVRLPNNQLLREIRSLVYTSK